LLGLKGFEDALKQVISTSIVLEYEAEPFKDSRLRGCKRAAFLLSIDRHGYDAFFNSPIGYRAQYCLGLEIGKSANRQIIEALKPRLLAFAERRTAAAFTLQKVGSSLDAVDAKIWIDESEPAAFPSSELQIEIDYRPWVDRAKRADAFQEDDFIGAMRGVRAPYGTRLEVKGGWLDDSGFEKLDPSKSRRSEWIAINGFT
jgi:hypothetical protein